MPALLRALRIPALPAAAALVTALAAALAVHATTAAAAAQPSPARQPHAVLSPAQTDTRAAAAVAPRPSLTVTPPTATPSATPTVPPPATAPTVPPIAAPVPGDRERAPTSRHSSRSRPVRDSRSPTSQEDLSRAVAALPDAGAGATWVLTDAHGAWGVADWHTSTVYISPRVPAHRLADVLVHEWAHLHTARVYAGDIPAMLDALNVAFHGRDLIGAENAADCIARHLGATWMHYTPCTEASWQQSAATLLTGNRL